MPKALCNRLVAQSLRLFFLLALKDAFAPRKLKLLSPPTLS